MEGYSEEQWLLDFDSQKRQCVIFYELPISTNSLTNIPNQLNESMLGNRTRSSLSLLYT